MKKGLTRKVALGRNPLSLPVYSVYKPAEATGGPVSVTISTPGSATTSAIITGTASVTVTATQTVIVTATQSMTTSATVPVTVTQSVPPIIPSVTVSVPPEYTYSLFRIAGPLDQVADPHERMVENPRVRVVDQFGALHANVTVSFSVLNASASVGTQSAATNASGEAETTWEVGSSAGPQQLVARVSGTSGPSMWWTAHVPNNILRFSAATDEGTSTGATRYRMYYTPDVGPKVWQTVDRSTVPYIEKVAGFRFDVSASQYVWDLADLSAFPPMDSLDGLYDVGLVALDSAGNYSPWTEYEDAYFYFGTSGGGGTGIVSLSGGSIEAATGVYAYMEYAASVTVDPSGGDVQIDAGIDQLTWAGFDASVVGKVNVTIDGATDGVTWTEAAADVTLSAVSYTQEFFDFSADSGYLALSAATTTVNGPTMVSYWMKDLSAPGAVKLLFGGGDGNTGTNFRMKQGFTSAGGPYGFFKGVGGGGARAVSAQTPVVAGAGLHHIVWAQTSNVGLRMWVDNVEITAPGGATNLDTAWTEISAFQIGRDHHHTSTGSFADAKVADFGVFPIYPTAAQVSVIYNGGVPIDPGVSGEGYSLGGNSMIFFGTSANWKAGTNTGTLGNFLFVTVGA